MQADGWAVAPAGPLQEWQSCRGTRPDSRGYTCGLWQLFHTLASRLPETENAGAVWLAAVKGFVKSYFQCTVGGPGREQGGAGAGPCAGCSDGLHVWPVQLGSPAGPEPATAADIKLAAVMPKPLSLACLHHRRMCQLTCHACRLAGSPLLASVLNASRLPPTLPLVQECAKHFVRHAAGEQAAAVASKQDAVLWMWRTHNIVRGHTLVLRSAMHFAH